MENEQSPSNSVSQAEQCEPEAAESHLVKRGKEYGLTPEQSQALSLYL